LIGSSQCAKAALTKKQSRRRALSSGFFFDF